MIAVESWAMFAEKGGVAGSVDFFPLREVIEAINSLHNEKSIKKTGFIRNYRHS